jgi:hypothetical protein
MWRLAVGPAVRGAHLRHGVSPSVRLSSVRAAILCADHRRRGSVADEYDTQTGVKGTLDRLQNGFISALPSSWIWVDEQVNFGTKILNATLHDIGIGNIKLETAKQFFPDMSWGDLVDYIFTDQGTIHIATMVIQQAVERLLHAQDRVKLRYHRDWLARGTCTWSASDAVRSIVRCGSLGGAEAGDVGSWGEEGSPGREVRSARSTCARPTRRTRRGR